MANSYRCPHDISTFNVVCWVAHDIVPDTVEIHKHCNACGETLGRAFVPLANFSYYSVDGDEVFPPGVLTYGVE
jgi:hypothetical protein